MEFHIRAQRTTIEKIVVTVDIDERMVNSEFIKERLEEIVQESVTSCQMREGPIGQSLEQLMAKVIEQNVKRLFGPEGLKILKHGHYIITAEPVETKLVQSTMTPIGQNAQSS